MMMTNEKLIKITLRLKRLVKNNKRKRTYKKINNLLFFVLLNFTTNKKTNNLNKFDIFIKSRKKALTFIFI